MTIPVFSLKLEGLTFPDFGEDKRKKNFRLMVDVEYFDKNLAPTTSHISFPVEEAWQWRDSEKRFFIPPKPAKDKKVELDFSVFTKDDSEFGETDIAFFEAQGKLHSVTVHIIDVFDKTFADHLKKIATTALPALIDAGTGGVVKLIGNKLVGTIIGQFKGDDISTQLLSKVGGKDKTLFKKGKPYSAFGDFSILGRGVFKDKNDMTGEYVVKFSHTDITPL